MNAAFLLVTTAWFAGADAAPAAAAAPAATAPGTVAAPLAAGGYGGAYGGSCCGGGDYAGGCGCCEVQCCKPSCLQRLKACFHRNTCCECCNTCNTCATTSCCNTCCNTGCGAVASTSCCGSYAGNVSSCGCGACCETSCCGSKHCRTRKHHNNCCNTCCEPVCGCGTGCGVGAVGGGCGAGLGTVPGAMPPASGEPIKLPKDAAPGNKLPSGKVQGEVNGLEVTPTSSKGFEETKNPFELDRRYETRVGRAADYGWVTGQLFYVHADGGLWVLRYAPLWKEDPNGGSVVLARDRQMDTFREGDLVKVHGEILNQKGESFLGGPQYKVETIELVDRPAR